MFCRRWENVCLLNRVQHRLEQRVVIWSKYINQGDRSKLYGKLGTTDRQSKSAFIITVLQVHLRHVPALIQIGWSVPFANGVTVVTYVVSNAPADQLKV